MIIQSKNLPKINGKLNKKSMENQTKPNKRKPKIKPSTQTQIVIVVVNVIIIIAYALNDCFEEENWHSGKE